MATNMVTTSQPRAFLNSAVGNLVVRPLQAQSVALRAATMVRIDEASNSFRVPVVTEDPAVAFVAEGEEIPASGAKLAEDASPFYKLAGLTTVSSEFLNDSSPAVAEIVTKGLARSLALKLDTAFFGKRGADTKAPRGLGDIDGVNTIAAGTKITSLDPFIDAIYAASKAGGSTLNAFVANPDDGLAIAKIKEKADSNRALLQSDPTKGDPTTEAGTITPAAAIAGVPMWITPACPKERSGVSRRTPLWSPCARTSRSPKTTPFTTPRTLRPCVLWLASPLCSVTRPRSRRSPSADTSHIPAPPRLLSLARGRTCARKD